MLDTAPLCWINQQIKVAFGTLGTSPAPTFGTQSAHVCKHLRHCTEKCQSLSVNRSQGLAERFMHNPPQDKWRFRKAARIVCVHIAWLLFMLLDVGTFVSTGESSVKTSWVVLSERYHSKSMAIPVLILMVAFAQTDRRSDSIESSANQRPHRQGASEHRAYHGISLQGVLIGMMVQKNG